jgi:heme/copper-type cytochrome/quinol oxidase subunit 2
VAVGLVIALAGCSQQQLQGWLPTTPGTTNHVDRVMGLWVTSWIVLLAVGLITWGLIIWAAVVYRRRKGQTGLPVQMRYNMPIEAFYTVVPLILVLGFFAFTARDQAEITAFSISIRQLPWPSQVSFIVRSFSGRGGRSRSRVRAACRVSPRTVNAGQAKGKPNVD